MFVVNVDALFFDVPRYGFHVPVIVLIVRRHSLGLFVFAFSCCYGKTRIFLVYCVKNYDLLFRLDAH